ncbi:hypothetical protein M0804_013552 [Polistes exclamans]|nr:hypothetical protein M0804_013552 [Polistes exclamans]
MLPFPVPFLKVYVDDVITAIPKDRMDQTLKTFNSVNNRIPFTMEVENNRTLPFLDIIIIRNEDGSIVTNCFYNLFKINSIYTKLKDRVDKLEQSNLLYKIPCVCDKCYIGQTKQKLKKRLEQHKNDCKPTNAQKSNITALAEHHFSTGDNFKFDEKNILDKEDNWTS